MLNNIKSIPTPNMGSRTYIITVFLFLTLGGLVQNYDLNLGLLFTNIFILLGYVLLVSKIRNLDLKEIFSFKKVNPTIVFRMFFLTIFLYLFLIPINSLVSTFILKNIPALEKLLDQIPTPSNGIELVKSIFFIAVLPAIFEELFFRGFLFKSLEKFGVKSKIILSSLFFTFLHFNPLNFVGPLFIGMVYGYLRHRTDSIFPSMICHFFNNSLAVILSYFVTATPDSADIDLISNLDIGFAHIMVMIVLCIILAAILYFLLKGIKNDSRRITIFEKVRPSETFFIVVNALICSIIFVMIFVSFASLN